MSRLNLVRWGAVVVLACASVACDAPSVPEDASVGVDASAIPDASTDAAMPSPRGQFERCASDVDCEEGLFCDERFPSPFCTRACTAAEECGDGDCFDGRCIPGCRSGQRDCDPIGGACLVLQAGRGVCLPACGALDISTSTCPGELTCDSYTGECVTNPASDGGAVGAPCEGPDDCRSGWCHPQTVDGEPTAYIDGMCLAITRSRGPDAAVERSSCPEGSVAVSGNAEGNALICYPGCSVHTDCRPGYLCRLEAGAPLGFCFPGCGYPGVRDCPEGARCETSDDGAQFCVDCTPACSGRECGSDGCGGECGTCGALETCTAAGTCECVAESDAELCAAAGAACGSVMVTDRCGVTRTASCGGCVAPSTCGAITPNQCDCVPETEAELCAAAGATCGALSTTDRCGMPRTASCGSCVAPETCGAVASNRCACVGESDTELCAASGASCGAISVMDRCGVGRSVSCGTCAAPDTCGGGGVANVCGCTPSCVGRVCGSDGCGGTCGSCPSGERCDGSGACEPIPCDPVSNTRCATGQKCEWDGSSALCVTAGTGLAGTSCFNTTHCAAEHTCTTEGFCREYCTGSWHCRTGRCAFDVSGTSFALCSRPCDPLWTATSDGCGGFGGCRLLDTPRATEFTDCGPRGSGVTGSACITTESCGDGLACISGECHRVCTRGSACSTGACMTVPGWSTYGVCPLL